MIFTHNSANPPLNMWLREARKCLVKNVRAKKMGDNMQVCFSQPKNLKRIASQKIDPKQWSLSQDVGSVDTAGFHVQFWRRGPTLKATTLRGNIL